jgi:hypothetical protein
MLAEFSLATFAPLVGSTFRVSVPAEIEGRGIVQLTLAAARGLGQDERCFVLELRGGPGTFVPQGTYRFEQPLLGSFEMFVSPTARSADGFMTEAVFNRLPST